MPTPSKSLKPGVSLIHNRAGGSPCILDREAIRLTNTFLHQGEEEADTTTTNTPTTSPPAVLTAPVKSILKKPVETVEPVFEVKKMVSQETSEYHLAEKVSQYDACPHKEEVTKSPTTPVHGKSDLGKSLSVTSKKPDASKSLAAASSKTAFTTTPNTEGSKPASYSRQTSEVTNSSAVASQRTGASMPTATIEKDINICHSTPKAFSSQPTSFHPPQPAALGRVAPTTTKTPILKTEPATSKLEVKHANQKIMVNSSLSPTLSRREVTPQQGEVTQATISPLTGRPMATESQAGPSYGSNLKSQLESMDSQYRDNLKKTNMIHEEQARKQQESLKPLAAFSSSPAPVSQVKSAVATSMARSQAVTASKLPQETSPTPAPSVLKNVTADLKKMDDVHSAHMKKIEDNFKEQDMRTRQPPTTDHHSSRPPTLGRSRFESPNSANRFSTSVTADSLRIDPVLRNTPAVLPMEPYVPRRNETVHDMTSFTSSKYESKSSEPNPIARSATTTLDTSYKSPEVSRRKFERNFNASPEPFPTSKSSSNVRFSDPPVSSVKPASQSKPPKIPATSASSTYSERTTSRPSYTERPYSTSSSSYLSTPSYVPSTSYLTSAPFSTSSYSTSSPYSSSSATSYSSPSTYSYSPKATSFPSPSENVTPTISSSPSYFSSSAASTPYSTTLDRTRSDTTLSMSRSAGDLQAKIQATKDQYKTSIKNAMNFDRTALKPPIIAQKLPRPEPSKYSVSGSSMSNTLEKREGREIRRMERERAVMEKVLGERSSRGKSDDLLTATRPSYRL